jgi:hypothetical protein
VTAKPTGRSTRALVKRPQPLFHFAVMSGHNARTPIVRRLGVLALALLASGVSAAAAEAGPWGAALPAALLDPVVPAALYPGEQRRVMNGRDFARFPGAGVMYCRTRHGATRKAAAAWLVGARNLVVMNAHNFFDRKMRPTTALSSCFFQIGGRNYEFDELSMQIGAPPGAGRLEINDDWALVRLVAPVEDPGVTPQPLPEVTLNSGAAELSVIMVSPGGHANFPSPSSIEPCTIRMIDRAADNGVRRVRHDCSDGYGGSGSGLFSADRGALIAMHSASLNINLKRDFDLEHHYGSAILFEGALLSAIRLEMGRPDGAMPATGRRSKL